MLTALLNVVKKYIFSFAPSPFTSHFLSLDLGSEKEKKRNKSKKKNNNFKDDRFTNY